MQKCNIYNCNIYVAQKYIKHKWIPIILFLLEKNEQMTFTQLLNQIEFISNKRLSSSLNILIYNNLLQKDINSNYSLTELGKHLSSIIILMSKFEGEFKNDL